jgi:hypothetical protein
MLPVDIYREFPIQYPRFILPTYFSSPPRIFQWFQNMKVDTATKLEGSIIVYAMGEEAYETELVEGTSHGNENKFINKRPPSKSTKLMKGAIANRRRKYLTSSTSVPNQPNDVVASIKHERLSTNPFDDHLCKHDKDHALPGRATNPFDDE